MSADFSRPEIQPISLTFHLSCWQNRRARIYIDGVSLDQFADTLDVGSFAKHLVLSGKDLDPTPLGELNGRSTLFYHHDDANSNVLELQVWHAENGRRCLFEEFGPRGENEPSMRLERVSTAKNRFYITLDCDKRLKVQRLVLVAVMRINGQLFVSTDAHFPPPSSKRGASPRLKGRAGPYETLLSFADSLHDDDRSPRSSLHASTGSSPPVSARRRASSLKSTSSTSSPCSTSSNDVNSWQTLVQWLLEARHASGAVIIQHLAQLSSIAIDFGAHAMATHYGTKTPPSVSSSNVNVDSIRQELLLWLETGQIHIMDLLESGFLHQCIPEPWFLGNISPAGSHAYLQWYCQRAGLTSAFLVRFSSPPSPLQAPIVPFPHLVIEAIWTNEQTGAQERYSAPIVFEHDPSGTIVYWIETANDAVPSRSPLLAEVIRYTCNTTGWPHVWRNPPHPQNTAGTVPVSSLGFPSSPGASASLDGISFHKPRSMPLLHSPSRQQPPATTLSRTPSNSGSIPARSPMLILPSRLGILSHDPAVNTSEVATGTEQPWPNQSGPSASQRSQNNFSLSRSDTLDNVSTESSVSTPHERTNTQSANAQDVDSDSFATRFDPAFDMAMQELDYMQGPSGGTTQTEPPAVAFPTDSIGARSMSDPTALRSWVSPPPGPSAQFATMGDGRISPNPYYGQPANSGHPFAGPPRFTMMPAAPFPYGHDGMGPLEAPGNFNFQASLHINHPFGPPSYHH